MDLQTLTTLFSTSFNPDPNVRMAGELEIRKVSFRSNERVKMNLMDWNERRLETNLELLLLFCKLLALILSMCMLTAIAGLSLSNELCSATRQACAVWVKNRVFRNYTAPTNPAGAIAPSDRLALRSSLLRLIASSSSRPIIAQLAKTVNVVAGADFPERWETLLVDIKVLLNSGDIREVHAGCVAALEVVRAFRCVFPPHTASLDHLT